MIDGLKLSSAWIDREDFSRWGFGELPVPKIEIPDLERAINDAAMAGAKVALSEVWVSLSPDGLRFGVGDEIARDVIPLEDVLATLIKELSYYERAEQGAVAQKLKVAALEILKAKP